MTYEIEQGRRARQPYLACRMTVPVDEMGQAMGEVFQRLYESLARECVPRAGEPWARFLAVGSEEVEFEVAAPTAVELEAPAGTIAGTMPACAFIATLHVGPYDAAAGAYTALATALAERELLVAGTPWEVYLTDPMTEPDPAKFRTMIYYPVQAAGAE